MFLLGGILVVCIMQIILNDFGSFLGKKGDRFVVKNGDKKEEFAVGNIDQILVAASSGFSTAAVKMALKNEIDVVFLSGWGRPLGRIFPCKLGGTTLTRKKQLEAYYLDKGADISKKLIKAKILNQAYFLKSLGKSRKKDFAEAAQVNIESTKQIGTLNGKIENIRDKLFGIEGMAASRYFDCLTQILPFKGRDKDSKDSVNILLNYGYGILYGETEKACILAGLDPYFGFLHTDRYNKPSMVLDLIEGFRPIIVDRAIVTLFVQKQVGKDFFEEDKEADEIIISKQGREKIIAAVMERLYTKVNFKGKQTPFQDIMLSQARGVANYVLDSNKEFEPFVYKW